MSLHRGCCCNPSALTCTQWCACLPDEVHITLSIVDSYREECGTDVVNSTDESLEMFDIQLLKSGCSMVSTDGGTINYSLSNMGKLYRYFTGFDTGASLAACIAQFNCGIDLCNTTTEAGGGTSVAGDLQISCFDPCGNSPQIAHSRLDIQPYLFTTGNQSTYGPCTTSSYNYNGIMRAYGALVGAEGCLDAGTWKRFINWDIPTSTFIPPVGSGTGCVNPFIGPQCDFLSPSKLTNWNHNYSVVCTAVGVCGSYRTCNYPGGSTECTYPPPQPPAPHMVATWTRTINVNMSVP